MDIRKKLKTDGRLILDGSMGALLMQKGIRAQDIPLANFKQAKTVTDIHKAYLNAGCDVIITNTFNLTSKTIEQLKISQEDIIKAALDNAAKAAAGFKNKAVAFGLSPSGEKSYEAAYENYAEQIAIGKDGADLIIIETISTLADIKAALSAARELSSLPFFGLMSFQANERTWYGEQLSDWISFINESDIDAAGLNCTLTPEEMLPLALKIKESTKKPAIAEPNRGQPENDSNGENTYRMSPASFANELYKFHKNGIDIIGGCCGSDEECMRAFCEMLK